MIATSLPVILSIWILSAGLVISAFHRWQQDKRILKLERRVFELEMRQTYPKWEG